MSHFSRVKTQLRDIATVQQVLEDLGYTVETGDVRGYSSQRAKADIVVRTDKNYDIGFYQQDDGSVAMIADFWGLSIDRDQFLEKITQRYAYLTVVEQAAEQGWQIAEEEVQEDGSLRLVMQRWS
jgi:hypothetical protein